MSKEWDKLYRTISNKGSREPEFVEIDKIHKPDWWDEFHQFKGDGNVKDSRERLKLFDMTEVDYSTIESLPAGSFFIVAVIQPPRTKYYINLRIATEGRWQTMLRPMGGPNYIMWQNSPITYFKGPSSFSNKEFKYYIVIKQPKFINWSQTNPLNSRKQ